VNKRKIALGPGAASLILIVVTLSLCMLAMLTMISGQNDQSLSLRSATMIESVYTLSATSEKRLAELDQILVRALKEAEDEESYLQIVEDNLPEDMTLDEDIVSWNEPLDNRSLECAVRLLPGGEGKRMVWVSHKLIVDEPEDDWEWN
jgi:hypothetical protein